PGFPFPEMPAVGPQMVDSLNFPAMKSLHIELMTWIKEGTFDYPKKGFEIPASHPTRDARIKFMEISPAPEYLTEDGRVVLYHKPMYHTADEIYILLGTNPNDIMDLGGKMELWLGVGDRAEKYTITKPSVVYIPAGLVHGPMVARELRTPIRQVIIFLAPYLVEYGVDEWPPEYKPHPETPSKFVDLTKVRLVSKV
ncbi:MAG: hypothetical protein QXR13_02540, partial [Candidatus Bathyarchaeia archaeon]